MGVVCTCFNDLPSESAHLLTLLQELEMYISSMIIVEFRQIIAGSVRQALIKSV